MDIRGSSLSEMLPAWAFLVMIRPTIAHDDSALRTLYLVEAMTTFRASIVQLPIFRFWMLSYHSRLLVRLGSVP